jgi:hypothetical protein
MFRVSMAIPQSTPHLIENKLLTASDPAKFAASNSF